MARKYRSAFNFAQQYAADKQGYSSGIENYLYLREETAAGVFAPPRLPESGSSISGATPSVDISAGTDDSFKIAVDGGDELTISLTLAGLTSGALIAAAVESAVNTALALDGQDGRICALFEGGLYKIYSQKAGPMSSVVVADADLDNVADDLKLGIANSGVEVAGTPTPDFLWMTKCAIGMSQAFEASSHRSGRQASSIIKQKKVCEGDLEMYVNFDETSVTPNIDTAVKTLLRQVFGNMVETASEVKFDNTQAPRATMSVVQANNAFNAVATGMFGKNWTLTLPGDGQASMKVGLKGRDTRNATPAKVTGALAGVPVVPVTAGEQDNFDVGARVMIVEDDGRTVVAGMDGTLTVTATTKATHSVTVSSPVTLSAPGGYIVPWMPHVLGYDGLIDNPVVGLQGSVSFDGGATAIEEITNVEFSYDPKTEDHDNFYGADGNRGYAVADRADIKCTVGLKMSASQIRKVMQAKRFDDFSMLVKLGDPAGRHLEIRCPRVKFSVPKLEVPDSGVLTVSLEGTCLQSAPGSHDAISLSYV